MSKTVAKPIGIEAVLDADWALCNFDASPSDHALSVLADLLIAMAEENIPEPAVLPELDRR